MSKIAIIAGLAQSLVNFRGPLLDAMLRAGHEVHAIGPEADPATLDWLSQRGVVYHQIPLARTGLSPRADLETLLAIRTLFKRLKPDIMIAYTIKPVIYGLIAGRLSGVPRRYAMITGLGYAFTEGAASLKRTMVGHAARLLYRIGIREAHAVAFQNPDDLAVFRQMGIVSPDQKVGIVNGSGVDTTRFAEAPLPDTPVCLMIARLVADKGVGEFIAAASTIKPAHPDATFVLVGPRDPNPAALPVGLVEGAIAKGVIDYRGEMEDVRPALAEASIYVLPSYREGTPRSVLEAMSMGRPVVTTDAPGCRETVTDGVNGLLVPVKSVDELAAALERLILDAGLRSRMGQAGRQMAVSRYDADEVAHSVLDLFDIEPKRRSV